MRGSPSAAKMRVLATARCREVVRRQPLERGTGAAVLGDELEGAWNRSVSADLVAFVSDEPDRLCP
jgi:hypothetical protein